MNKSVNAASLAGKLLLAVPSIGDPRFNKAVIFICSHDENGAMGLVINHALTDISFENLLDQLKIKSDIQIDLSALKIQVMSGGPVESARGFMLHTGDFRRQETMSIDAHYAITGTIEALRDVIRGEGPERMLFILGYAGWGAGQLEAELQQNAWLVADPDPDVIFHGAPEEKWTLAYGTLGINPAMLSAASGRA